MQGWGRGGLDCGICGGVTGSQSGATQSGEIRRLKIVQAGLAVNRAAPGLR